MAKITRIHHADSADESGMGEYKKKLFLHRTFVGGRIIVLAAVVVCALIACGIWYVNRTYSGYKVASSTEHTTAVDTLYAEYNGNIIKYSHDGISCVTRANEALWSQTYNMQDPILDISDEEVVIADKSGNEAYVFNSDGLQTQISTLMPISQVSISSGGVTAVMVDDGSSSYIYIYDSAATELAVIKCSLDETGQPMSVAVSPDGAKLAVSYLQVQEGQADSCLVFYNFGSVGSNYVDKIVSTKLYSGEIIPRVEYMTDSLCVAVSDSQIIYFEGDEIPEEAATVQIGVEIQSVFFGDSRVGIIVEGDYDTAVVTEDDEEENEDAGEEDAGEDAAADAGDDADDEEETSKYEVWLFDSNGKRVQTIGTDLEYTDAKLSGGTLILYGGSDCEIYSSGGVLKYSGEFESTINCIYRISGLQRYVVVYADSTDVVRLQ